MHQGWTPGVAPTSFQCDRIGQTLRNTDWDDDTDHRPKACHHAIAQQLPPNTSTSPRTTKNTQLILSLHHLSLICRLKYLSLSIHHPITTPFLHSLTYSLLLAQLPPLILFATSAP